MLLVWKSVFGSLLGGPPRLVACALSSYFDLTVVNFSVCLFFVEHSLDLADSGSIGGERIRLICMGKGYLMPDTRTLQDCQIPVFKTHPTPINVSIKPAENELSDKDGAGSGKKRNKKGDDNAASNSAGNNRSSNAANNSSGTSGGGANDSSAISQGCSCAIL